MNPQFLGALGSSVLFLKRAAALLCVSGLCLLEPGFGVPLQGADAATDQAIQQHRTGTLVVLGPPGTPVRVRQTRHQFWFGAALSSGVFGRLAHTADAVIYKRCFLTNFNAAVTENALKWHAMERQQGQVDYSVLDAMLDWTEQHDIPLRGHNIFWGVPNFVQDWIKQLGDEALREAVRERALQIARRYRGRFAEYDLNNEMIHGNYYEERLGPGITKEMALWVREGDPRAVLYLNDYDILTGNRLDDYVSHIGGLLAQGTPIGGIGVQGHIHGETFDPKALKLALDTLAQFQLPVRVTEFNMPGQRSSFYRDRRRAITPEEEAAKARALVDYYRICFAHPAVHGILMWGFWEGANWIPASSLYRRDWTPTPAALAYQDLVFRLWWTRFKGQTDEQGRCEIRAFLGRHQVVAGDRESLVELKHPQEIQTVSFP